MHKSRDVTIKTITAAPRTRQPSNTNVIVQTAPTKKSKKGGKKKNKGQKVHMNPSVNLGNQISKAKTHLWAASLLDPWGVRTARIPDAVVVPTSTITSTFRMSLSAIAYGSSGTAYGMGGMLLLGNISPQGYSPIYIAKNSTNGLNYTDAPNSYAYPNANALIQCCNQIRMVSAGLAIYSTCSSTNNQGRISLASWTDSTQQPTNDVTNATWTSSYPCQKICPMNSGEVCSVTYRPTSSNFDFRYAGGTVDIGPNLKYGGLGFMVTGCANTATLELVIVVNWEVIPINTFAGILETQISLSDPAALAAGLNAGAGGQFMNFPGEVMSTTNSVFSVSPDAQSFWSHLPSIETVSQKIHGARTLMQHASTIASGASNLYQLMYGVGGVNPNGFNIPARILYSA